MLQLSFQMWTDEMQETLNTKKKGDASFKQKDFRVAIECYTQVFSSFQSCQFLFKNYVRNYFYIILCSSRLIIQFPYHTKLHDFRFFFPLVLTASLHILFDGVSSMTCSSLMWELWFRQLFLHGGVCPIS
jgi:hypothetical protein